MFYNVCIRPRERETEKVNWTVITRSQYDIMSVYSTTFFISFISWLCVEFIRPLERSSFSDSWRTSYKWELLKAHGIAQTDLNRFEVLCEWQHTPFLISKPDSSHNGCLLSLDVILLEKQRLQMEIICRRTYNITTRYWLMWALCEFYWCYSFQCIISVPLVPPNQNLKHHSEVNKQISQLTVIHSCVLWQNKFFKSSIQVTNVSLYYNKYFSIVKYWGVAGIFVLDSPAWRIIQHYPHCFGRGCFPLSPVPTGPI